MSEHAKVNPYLLENNEVFMLNEGARGPTTVAEVEKAITSGAAYGEPIEVNRSTLYQQAHGLAAAELIVFLRAEGNHRAHPFITTESGLTTLDTANARMKQMSAYVSKQLPETT